MSKPVRVMYYVVNLILLVNKRLLFHFFTISMDKGLIIRFDTTGSRRVGGVFFLKVRWLMGEISAQMLGGFKINNYLCKQNINGERMSARREKSKPQLNTQLEMMENKPKIENTWLENLGKYLLDISKFVTTGVVIASLFKDMDDRTAIYIIGTVVAVSTLIVGLVLTNKKRKKEN